MSGEVQSRYVDVELVEAPRDVTLHVLVSQLAVVYLDVVDIDCPGFRRGLFDRVRRGQEPGQQVVEIEAGTVLIDLQIRSVDQHGVDVYAVAQQGQQVYSSIEISQRCECRRVVRFEHGDLVDSEFAVEYVEPQFLDGYLPADEFLAVFFKVVFRDRRQQQNRRHDEYCDDAEGDEQNLDPFFHGRLSSFLSGSVC